MSALSQRIILSPSISSAHFKRFAAVLLIASLMLEAVYAQTSTADETLKANASGSASLLNASQQSLADALADQPNWLQQVYLSVDYQSFWSTDDSDSSAREKLIEFMQSRIESNRLNESDYDLVGLRNSASLNYQQREILSAKVFAKLAQDLFDGRMSALMEIPEDYEMARDLSREKILLRAYQHGNPMAYLDLQTPDNFLVESLLAALKRYQKIQQSGAWPVLSMSESKLELGDRSEVIPLIRERLKAEGFLQQDSADNSLIQKQLNRKSQAISEQQTSTWQQTNVVQQAGDEQQNTTEHVYNLNVYSQADVDAVKRFQLSRSILVDGIIGSGTLEAMNQPVEDLLTRLHINIERARWLPSKFTGRSVLVNIADYRVRMYNGETLADSMKVIVGKDHTQTPVFADTMERVVINPYWNIPRSIVCCELAPKVLENPNYLKEKNMEVLSGWGANDKVIDESTVDWQAATQGDFSFRVRQKPGPTNALGLIKFLFPNDHAIYLHDTPADSLFERDKRAFSHGCIRLEKPIEFANFVMKNKLGWSGERAAKQIESGEREVVELDEEIPVYIGYFTAWADPQGNVSFARDLYDRDARVITGLGL